jgi:Tfp pilus assembly PilM family ATPase
MINIFTKLLQSLTPRRFSIGIEITDTAVKIVEVDLHKGRRYRIRQYGWEPLPQGTMDDGKIKEPYVLINTIQTLLAKTGIKSKKVNLVLPSQLVMVRFLKLPDIADKDMAKLVEFEVKHNIHFPFDDPIFDFSRTSGKHLTAAKRREDGEKKEELPEGAAAMQLQEAASAKELGTDLGAVSLFGEPAAGETEKEPEPCDVMLVAAPRELINGYMDVVQACRLSLISIECKALSLLRVIRETRFIKGQETFLLVDVNESCSDVSIFHGFALKITRSVPLPFVHKEEGKAAADEELDLSFLSLNDYNNDFQAVCGDLAHELERLMNFYRYTLNNRNQEFARIVLSGDVVKLMEIADFLKQRLNMEVSILTSANIDADGAHFEHTFPALAVPIGLALRGNEA